MLNLLCAPGTGPDPALPRPEVFRYEINVGDDLDPLLENTYLVVNPATRQALLIDPGSPDEAIDACLAEKGLKLIAILRPLPPCPARLFLLDPTPRSTFKIPCQI